MQKTQFRGNMNAGNGPVNTQTVVYTCGRCTMFYYDYKHLVEHLYWRHGTESLCCKQCGLKKWRYATHLCNILPIDDKMIFQFTLDDSSRAGYCFCGEDVVDAPMIGCDASDCPLQWYHFKCVGIVLPPDGDWFCPQCTKSRNSLKIDSHRDKHEETQT